MGRIVETVVAAAHDMASLHDMLQLKQAQGDFPDQDSWQILTLLSSTCSERRTLHMMAEREPFLWHSPVPFWLQPMQLPDKAHNFSVIVPIGAAEVIFCLYPGPSCVKPGKSL